MLTSVAGNKTAIGYISLGSLNKTVKALKIDGAAASVANIKAGSYKIARPFNIVTKTSGVSDNAADFIRYILSKEGQAVVEKNGYISAVENPSYIPTGKKGKVTVAGSSSVTPVMQQATRVSDNTAFFLLGKVIEYGTTEQIFSSPKNKKTEDYITGRFG